MFNDLKIGLKGYELLQASHNNGLQIVVELKTQLEPKSCPLCSSSQIRSKGRYLRKVRHLECFREPSTLHIRTRRFQCLNCRRSFLPNLPGVTKGRRSSEPFRYHIFEQHDQGICTRTIAKRQDLGEATVERIYHQFTRLKAAERLSLQCPTYLGIDEHTLHKGQRFCTTFCDLKNHRIFEVQPGRSEVQLSRFLLTLKGREKVQTVCIDLSSPYRRLIRRYFPNARIVADRFHVVRIIFISHHFLQLARLLVPELKHHRGSLAALRKAPEKLTSRQSARLKGLFETHPALQPLHHKTPTPNSHESKEQNQKAMSEAHQRATVSY